MCTVVCSILVAVLSRSIFHDPWVTLLVRISWISCSALLSSRLSRTGGITLDVSSISLTLSQDADGVVEINAQDASFLIQNAGHF
ncbi:hypothetical protein EDD21DRAFT_180671 [Dissophora ornata]|nr:hypothetical protein EDD21DRAFT_180671 [Dissophora ornata]